MENTQTESKGTKKRMSISLPKDTLESLNWLAEEQGISFNQAIRQAIATESYIREQLQEKSKILVQKKDKSIHELVFR